jgi:hypothetical protein
MKKVIVFTLVLAVAVGSAFAIDLGGTVFGAVKLFVGDTTKERDPTTAATVFEDRLANRNATGWGGMTRIRLEGSGEAEAAGMTFGGWMRWEPASWDHNPNPQPWEDEFTWDNPVSALAWWQPIDAFKMTIGGNPDGIFGKEGYAGWMFYQNPSDVNIVDPADVWGGGYFNPGYAHGGDFGGRAKFRDAFWEGVGDNRLMFEIKPMDMLGINITVPYFNGGDMVKNIWKLTTAQVDVNLDGIGNVALSYAPTDDYPYYSHDTDPDGKGGVGANFYLYFNLTAVENLSLDVGLGLRLPESFKDENTNVAGYPANATVTRDFKRTYPVAFGLGAKMDVNESFGFKARLLVKFGGEIKDETTYTGQPAPIARPPYVAEGNVKYPFSFGIDVLPYYTISDSMKAFLGLGLRMIAGQNENWRDTYAAIGNAQLAYEKPPAIVSWFVNPYVQIGAEWGPTFYAGLRIFSYGDEKTFVPSSVANTARAATTRPDEYTPVHVEIPIGIQVSF